MGGDIPSCPGFLTLSPSSFTLPRSGSADHQQTSAKNPGPFIAAVTHWHTFSTRTLLKSLPEHFRTWMRVAGARSCVRSGRFWPGSGAPRHPGCPRDAGFDVPQRFHCAGEFPWCISMTHCRCQLIHLCDTTVLFSPRCGNILFYCPPLCGTILTAAALANCTERGAEMQKCQFYTGCPLPFSQDFAVTLLLADTHLLLGLTSSACFPSLEGVSAGSRLWICSGILLCNHGSSG